MKRLYVVLVRGLRALLRAVGVLALLDRWARRSRTGLWVRSLLSIYDPAEMLAYDVPWWTFASADLVAQHLRAHPDPRVFEWGSGASTLWLSRRAGSVTSVEHDPDWAASMQPVLPDNVTLRVVPPAPADGRDDVLSHKPGFAGLDFAAYVAAIDDTEGDFDLIVIDGRAREACLARALGRLRPGGLVLFDNVDRQRYVDAIEAAGGSLQVRWTRGLTPSLPYPTRTAVIATDGG